MLTYVFIRFEGAIMIKEYKENSDYTNIARTYGPCLRFLEF